MEQFVTHLNFISDEIENNSKFLTVFAFIRGSYGLRISVVGCMGLTEFSERNNFVRGYIEHRGEKIAVIDPKMLFESDLTPINEQTCIVIIEPRIGSGSVRMAVIVEDLSEVLNIVSYKMEQQDEPHRSANIDFVLKLGRESDMFELVRSIGKSLELHSIDDHCYNCE